MELKPGYKQSEIGIIPNYWIEIPLNKLVTEFRGGAPLSPNDFIDNGFKVLPKSGVGRGGKLFIEKDKLQYCNTEYAANHKSNQVDNSYTIVVLRDLVPSGPNIGLMVKIDSNDCYILAQGVYGFKANSDLVDPNYLIHLSNTSHYRKLMNNIMVGSTQVHITNTAFLKIKFTLPPTKEEQTAIAQALSDTDKLISSLNKLITKKRNIKQGAMQLLLSGKKQLSGYSEKWVIKKMKDFVTQFIVPMRNKPKIFSGEIPWCRIEDFDGKYLFDSKSSQYVNNEIIQQMNLKIYPKETLLVSCSADLGRCAIVKKELVTNQTFIGLVIDPKKTSNEFLFYYMTFNASILNTLSSGTTISYMSREQFENFEVTIPSTKEEQTAIAQILSDMDSEIETLEKKRDKYKAIKQGMMQELLTGRIRLVKPKSETN